MSVLRLLALAYKIVERQYYLGNQFHVEVDIISALWLSHKRFPIELLYPQWICSRAAWMSFQHFALMLANLKQGKWLKAQPCLEEDDLEVDGRTTRIFCKSVRMLWRPAQQLRAKTAPSLQASVAKRSNMALLLPCPTTKRLFPSL